MGIRADGDIASAELAVASADGREFLDAARRGEAARVDLDDGIRLDERTQDGVDVIGEIAIADLGMRERGIPRNVVDMREGVNEGMRVDLVAHDGKVLMVHLRLFAPRKGLRIVEILALQKVNRAEDEVKGNTLHERGVFFACARHHSHLDTERKIPRCAQGLVCRPIRLGIKDELLLSRRRVVIVEVLGEDKPDSLLLRAGKSLLCPHLGVSRKRCMNMAVKEHGHSSSGRIPPTASESRAKSARESCSPRNDSAIPAAASPARHSSFVSPAPVRALRRVLRR